MDWFNNNLSEYIDNKEKILVDTRKNDNICRLTGVMGGLFIALFVSIFITMLKMGAIGVIKGQEPDLGANWMFAAVLFVCCCLLCIGLVYKSNRATRYVLTDSGIYKISGLIFKKFKFVAYNQITDVDMSRGLSDQFFGCGSVGVGTASGNIVGSVSDGNRTIYSMNELDIDHVDNYQEIRKIIVEHRKK